jgi:hypothetical protein
VCGCTDEALSVTCGLAGQLCGNATNNCGHSVTCGRCGAGQHCCFDSCVCSTCQCP